MRRFQRLRAKRISHSSCRLKMCSLFQVVVLLRLVVSKEAKSKLTTNFKLSGSEKHATPLLQVLRCSTNSSTKHKQVKTSVSSSAAWKRKISNAEWFSLLQEAAIRIQN